jgi:hypothetical protein
LKEFGNAFAIAGLKTTSAPWKAEGIQAVHPPKIVARVASRRGGGAGRAVRNATVAGDLDRPAIGGIAHRRIFQEPRWSGWKVIERCRIFRRDLSDDKVSEGPRRGVRGRRQSKRGYTSSKFSFFIATPDREWVSQPLLTYGKSNEDYYLGEGFGVCPRLETESRLRVGYGPSQAAPEPLDGAVGSTDAMSPSAHTGAAKFCRLR